MIIKKKGAAADSLFLGSFLRIWGLFSDLAAAMKVSPPQITKIVKGQENLTLETQVRLQEILDIPILASYYEKTGTLSPTDESK